MKASEAPYSAKKIKDIKEQLEKSQLDDYFSNEEILSFKWNYTGNKRVELKATGT